MKTTEYNSSLELVTSAEKNITYLANTNNVSSIYLPLCKQDRVIKKVGCSGDKVDEVGIIDINSTKVLKSVKSKDLI